MSVTLSTAMIHASGLWSEMKKEGLTLEKAAFLAKRFDAPMRGAVMSLIYTTVRTFLKTRFVKKALVQKAPPEATMALLDVGLALLIENQEENHTVVNEAVTAAKLKIDTYAAGFINAVLRNFLRRRAEFENRFATDPQLRFEVPRWWFEKVRESFPDRFESVLTRAADHPPFVLRVNTTKICPEAYFEKLAENGIEAQALGDAAVLVLQPRPVEALPGFAEGFFSVQDAASQLVTRFLALRKGEKLLDACAAPGGKTCALLEASQASVTALDENPARCEMIRDNLKRLDLKADIFCADTASPDALKRFGRFDAVLLDAPCTASGILARHPDIAHMRQEADVARLAQKQAALLKNLWQAVKPGGKLLYCVCSIFKEEGVSQIAKFLAATPDAKPENLPGFETATLLLAPTVDEKDTRLPRVHDGFFYALLRKEAAYD